jgi:hypothetical protein
MSLFSVQKTLQTSYIRDWSDRRRQVIMMRYRLFNALDDLSAFGFDIENILGIDYDYDWKFYGYPWWSLRGSLNDHERQYNGKVKLETSRIIPPFDRAMSWSDQFIHAIEEISSELSEYNEMWETFETLWNLNDRTLPSLRKNFKKLISLWKSRDRKLAPPCRVLAALPIEWQNGVVV